MKNIFNKKFLNSLIVSTSLMLISTSDIMACECAGPIYGAANNIINAINILKNDMKKGFTATQANQEMASKAQIRNRSELQSIKIKAENEREQIKYEMELEQKYQNPSISASLVAGVADRSQQAEADFGAQESKYSSTLLHRKINTDAQFIEKTKAYAAARDSYKSNGKMPYADISVDSILSGAGASGKNKDLTFSEEQITAAGRYILNSISTNIPPSLPSNLQMTRSGQEYEIARREALSKMSLAQKIHTDALAYRTPVEALKADGGGKISHAEFIERQINARYGNSNWLVALEAGSESRLMKEALYMSALALKLQQQQNEHLEKIALGIAQLIDNTTNSAIGNNLKQLRQKAIQTGVTQEMKLNK